MSGELVPRALYRTSHRELLCRVILEAVEAGVKIPDDMPVDTPEHIKMAIVYVAGLIYCPRDGSVSLW